MKQLKNDSKKGKKMDEGWVISIDEEIYFHCKFYKTKELAIAAAPRELDLKPGRTFYVGYAITPNGEEWIPNGEKIIDYMIDDYMIDDVSVSTYGYEYSETWLQNVSEEDVQKLSDAIHITVAKWMDKTGNRPQFYSVNNVEKHKAPEATKDVKK